MIDALAREKKPLCCMRASVRRAVCFSRALCEHPIGVCLLVCLFGVFVCLFVCLFICLFGEMITSLMEFGKNSHKEIALINGNNRSPIQTLV